MTVYIYDLSDPRTGDIRYIGKSVNPKERLAEHIRQARKGDVVHCRRWIAGLLAQGVRPQLGLLEECKDNGDEAERFWIASFKLMGARLTNRTPGGDGQSVGYVTSPETRRKLREAALGKKKSAEACANMRTALATPEAKARRRQIIEELKKDPQWRHNIGNSRRGKRLSEETKRKMSEAWTPERKAKHAEEQKAKPVDERWRAQLAAAIKARWDKHRANKCSPSANAEHG